MSPVRIRGTHRSVQAQQFLSGDIAFVTDELREGVFNLWLQRFMNYVWDLQKATKEGVQWGSILSIGVNNTTGKCLLSHQSEKTPPY